MSIFWKGKSTSGVSHWSYEADSFMELYNWLLKKGIVNTVDYDPYEKAVAENAGLDYDAVVAEVEEASEEDGDFGKHWEEMLTSKGLDGSLTDEDFMLMISGEDGNAYYQSFAYDKDFEHELEFNAKGKLIDKEF